MTFRGLWWRRVAVVHLATSTSDLGVSGESLANGYLLWVSKSLCELKPRDLVGWSVEPIQKTTGFGLVHTAHSHDHDPRPTPPRTALAHLLPGGWSLVPPWQRAEIANN